jgi:hypothetical protein
MTTDNVPQPADFDAVRSEIRQICHDLSNPVGVLRMAVYVMQSSKGDEEKRLRYFGIMNESIDKIDLHLQRLRALALGEQKTAG